MLAHPLEECTLNQGRKGLDHMGCVLVLEELALVLSDWHKCWRNHRSSIIPSLDNPDQARPLTSRWSVDLCIDLL